MMIFSDIGIEEKLIFKIEQEISFRMDLILKNMQKMALEFEISEADKKSPFKNVLGVAIETQSSLEIIKTYVRYQVGRQGSSPIWKKNIKGKTFATAVVEQIDGLAEDAQVILEKVISSSTKDNPLITHIEENKSELIMKIHLKLTQLYLGYLSREHTALVGNEKAKKK